MIKILETLNSLRKKKEILLIFVCTANCCRSPIAEILFEKMLKHRDAEGSGNAPGELKLRIESAATSYSGFSMAETSMEILIEEENIPEERCLKHIGRNLSEIENPDLILTMTENHANTISDRFPYLADKTFTLDQFVKSDRREPWGNIEDPIGGSRQDFIKAKNHIKEDLTLLLEEFKKTGLLEPLL